MRPIGGVATIYISRWGVVRDGTFVPAHGCRIAYPSVIELIANIENDCLISIAFLLLTSSDGGAS